MKTADRVLSVLRLFTVERPEWTVDQAMQELGLSQSTAYEYFRSLVEAGLLVVSKTGRYVIGPAIIEFDRLTRIRDPLILNARPVLERITTDLPAGSVGLLCRAYRLTVMCVDQFSPTPTNSPVSYERGRPMPLFRGAASKIILAHMPRRKLRRYFDQFAGEVAAAGMGDDWESFRATLRRIRAAGVCVTYGELDKGRIGISGPVFSSDGEILGSIGVVVQADALASDKDLRSAVEFSVDEAGRELTQRLKEPEAVQSAILRA